MSETTGRGETPKSPSCPGRSSLVSRDFAVAFSLANICFLWVWSENLAYSVRDTFWMRWPPRPVVLVATMIDVVILGSALRLGLAFARRHNVVRWVTLWRWGLVLLLAIPLNAVRNVLSNRDPRFYFLRAQELLKLIGAGGVEALVLGVSAAAFLVLRRYSRPLAQATYALLLIFSPFVLFTFTQSISAIRTYNAAAQFADKPLAAALPVHPGAPRVLWIVFDEMDERLAFINRDPSLRLPEFDRLRAQSLFAANAYPPGKETKDSVPSYIVGRLVKDYKETGPDDMQVAFHSSRSTASWRELPNVFQRARQAGLNTAVVGWYLPYCRSLADDLTTCTWWPPRLHYNSFGETLSECMADVARSLVETNAHSLLGRSLSTQRYVEDFPQVVDSSKRAAADPGLGFVFLHLPTPHAPHVYDRATGRFSRRSSSLKAYPDSLALADRTLGELRHALQASGLWDSIVLLVTSDHHYRDDTAVDGKSDLRVPFMLKLPGQQSTVEYQPAFNTVLSGDLLMEIVHGQIKTPEAVVHWLDTHRRDLPLQ